MNLHNISLPDESGYLFDFKPSRIQASLGTGDVKAAFSEKGC